MLKRSILMGAIAFIGVVGLVGTSSSAHAASPLQLINITPSSSSVSIDPGTNIKGSVDVINQGDIPFDVTVTSAPYYVEGLNYDPHFTQLPGTVDASKWVDFQTATAGRIESKKLLSVDYTITVPEGTAPGGYYAVIFAKTGASTNGTGISSHGRVGDILYISVNGNVTKEGTARENAVPTLISRPFVDLNVIVGNKGGVHFLTTVDILVKNVFNKTVFSYRADRYVLPQTEREIATTWSTNAPLGIYHIERTATLPNGDANLASQWVVVVQPWVIIALIAIIVVLVGTSITHIRRTRKAKHHE
jgi:hypothetical protein